MLLSYINGFDGSLAQLIVDSSLALLFIGCIIFACIKYKLSNKVIVVVSILLFLFILSVVFGLELVKYITLVFMCLTVVFTSLLLTSQEKEAELKRHEKISRKENKELSVSETDMLIKNLESAVNTLSETQTGALIVFEKTDDMTKFVEKSGTKVDAPLTPEMLLTIFYKGTPLHDGATIVRGNMIYYSAVFFQPTQRALSGKYGSRHRAAIGISEVCDALTIVVSEETGKVSLTYKGDLISIPVGEFANKFRQYYELTTK